MLPHVKSSPSLIGNHSLLGWCSCQVLCLQCGRMKSSQWQSSFPHSLFCPFITPHCDCCVAICHWNNKTSRHHSSPMLSHTVSGWSCSGLCSASWQPVWCWWPISPWWYNIPSCKTRKREYITTTDDLSLGYLKKMLQGYVWCSLLQTQ